MLDARGRIQNAEVIEAVDDAAAIAAADELQQRHRIPGYELWQAARRVISKQAPPS